MISKLTGKIDELKPTELILDVHDVGYHLLIPFSTYNKIKDLVTITVYVYTHHKEDQFRLFGFSSEREKNLFSLLLNISGIGPNMALAILSGIEIDELFEAVKHDNPSILIKIPGIGKSKAEKLIFEIKRKIKKFKDFTIDTKKAPLVNRDAYDALISLGFDEARVASIINSIINENPGMSVEDVIKNALKQL